MNPFTWLNQLLCFHDDLWVIRPGRIYLQCHKCRRATPGWEVPQSAPRRPTLARVTDRANGRILPFGRFV